MNLIINAHVMDTQIDIIVFLKVCIYFKKIVNLFLIKLNLKKYLLLSHKIDYNIENENIIDKDLDRTYPELKYFKNKNNITILKQCLLYFSELNNNYYVQGMNYIVGSILLHCNIEYTLYIINILFKKLSLKDIYSSDLKGVYYHGEIIFNLINSKIPKLYNKFIQNNISIEIFLVEWIMTLGTCIIPIKYHQILFYGITKYNWSYLYLIIIKFYKFNEDIICKLSDTELIVQLKNSKNIYKNSTYIKDLFDWELLLNESLNYQNIKEINNLIN